MLTRIFSSILCVLVLLTQSCSDQSKTNNGADQTFTPEDGCLEANLEYANLKSTEGITSLSSKYKGFFFTTSDSGFSSSDLKFNNFENGRIYTVLVGESSDIKLSWTSGRLFLFNRATGNLNFRILTPIDSGFKQSCQFATPQASVGDAHDVIQIDPKHAIITYGVKGQIVLMNTVTGELVQQLTDFDVGENSLNAFTLHQWEAETILAPHQGISDDYSTATKTEAVFVLKYADESLSIVDQNLEKMGNQGVKTGIHNPVLLKNSSNQNLTTFGLCGSYSPKGCTAGAETFTKEGDQWTTAHKWNLNSSTLKLNGEFVYDGDTKIYASTIVSQTKAITSFDLSTLKTRTIHSFSEESSGYSLLIYDDSTNSLYVGDAKGESGQISTYSQETIETILPIVGLPNNGVLIEL